MEKIESFNFLRQNNHLVEQAKYMAKEAKINLREGIILAKSKWTDHLTTRLHDLTNTSRNAWKATTTQKVWIQGHQKSLVIIRLKNNDGKFTETDEEDFELLYGYFKKVFKIE